MTEMTRPLEATEMETASGRPLDVFLPQPVDVDLKDVARGLAQTCRFAGQCDRFYSVAEHAVLVSRKLMDEGHPELALAGLHHDDHKAYLGELASPLERALLDDCPLWRSVVDGLRDAISVALGLDWPEERSHPELASANRWARMLEAETMMPSGGQTWELGELPWPLDPPLHWAAGLSSDAARELWLYWHHQLGLRTAGQA